MENTIQQAIADLGDRCKNAEIAFFGGSFTAINREYMLSLLNATKKYIDKFYGIRISTRADYINEEILSLLKSYNVTSIELGAQSMDDTVLKYNHRGHTAKQVIGASNLIKSKGFSLGLQMMTGLYMSDFEKDVITALEFIKLKPDTVRIYPTVILDNTYLGELFKTRKFNTHSLEESVNLCAKLLLMFQENDISVIRLGLHYSESLNESMLYNNYHPAFKELCENKIFKDKLSDLLENNSFSSNIEVFINPKSKSKFIGQGKSNIKYLLNLGYNVKIIEDSSLNTYDIIIK